MRVLVYTSPARGHLYPIVPTLDALASRGHQITVVTIASEVAAMTGRGFVARGVAPAIEAVAQDDYAARGTVGKLKRSMAVFGRRAGHEIGDLRAAISEHRPDVLLVDCNSWGGAATAERWGGPWGQWLPYPLPLPASGVPPFGPGLAPARGTPGRTRDALLRRTLERTFSKAALPAINSARHAAGVAPFTSVYQWFTAAPLLLYLTAEPFEYRRDAWPANLRLLGPGAWDPATEEPSWLAGVDRPVVLVTTSTEFQDDGRLARATIDALAGEDLFVVATLPSASIGGPVPANARVERFVPHGPILARAACAVTHGGMGATQKALAAGVPVCVVPFGRDQMEVARRVEVAGAGTRLPSRRLGAVRLRRAVLEAMDRGAGAARVAAGLAATGGAQAGADAVEQMCAGSTGADAPPTAAK